jgi:hypothetical protein
VLAGVIAILDDKAKEKGIGVNFELSDKSRFVKTDIVWVKNRHCLGQTGHYQSSE